MPKGIVKDGPCQHSEEVDPYLWIPSGPLDHEVSLRYVLLEDADHERPNVRWLSAGVTRLSCHDVSHECILKEVQLLYCHRCFSVCVSCVGVCVFCYDKMCFTCFFLSNLSFSFLFQGSRKLAIAGLQAVGSIQATSRVDGRH